MATLGDWLLQRLFGFDSKSTSTQWKVRIRSHSGAEVEYTEDQVMDWLRKPAATSGYEPWFAERGFSPPLARLMAGITVNYGKREARESGERPQPIAAIRFIAKKGRRGNAAQKRLQYILNVVDTTTTADTLFDEIGGDEELIYYMRRAVQGDKEARVKVQQIAAALEPKLPESRGPKVTVASAAHEFLLTCEFTNSRKYSWNSVTERFTDPLTEATRTEFGLPYFDPRPAVRRRERASGKQRNRAF